jgi:hypothetical protein
MFLQSQVKFVFGVPILFIMDDTTHVIMIFFLISIDISPFVFASWIIPKYLGTNFYDNFRNVFPICGCNFHHYKELWPNVCH